MRRLSLAASLLCLSGITCASSPVVVDGEGRILGFYLGEPTATNQLRVITTMGYTATYALNSGELLSNARDAFGIGESSFSAFFFESNDCSGQPFVEANADSRGGGVARAGNTGTIWYLAKNAQPVAFTTLSRLDTASSTCEAGTFDSGPFMEVRENSPGTTGVSNDPVVPPLRIEVLEVSANSWRIFHDGFESSGLPAEVVLVA